jgi:hypothetical protein
MGSRLVSTIELPGEDEETVGLSWLPGYTRLDAADLPGPLGTPPPGTMVPGEPGEKY